MTDRRFVVVAGNEEKRSPVTVLRFEVLESGGVGIYRDERLVGWFRHDDGDVCIIPNGKSDYSLCINKHDNHWGTTELS